MCFSAAVFLFGVFLYIFVAHDFGFYLMGLSSFLVLMLFAVTSLSFRRVYRRNSRMFGSRTITISDAGFISDSPMGRIETTWNLYEKFRETNNLFLLYQSADLIGILPKRVFATPADLQQFRSLLTAKFAQGNSSRIHGT
jgi:YcxB-like protein